MGYSTPKVLASRIQPKLRSKKTGTEVQIYIEGTDTVIAIGSTANKAWEEAYHLYAKDQFNTGNLVVMENCLEAESAQNKVWQCRSDSFKTINNDYGVFLENYSGYFLCEFLRKATNEEEYAYHLKKHSETIPA